MKSTAIILGAGLLTLAASCSNSSVDAPDQIQFSDKAIKFTASVPYAQTSREVITTAGLSEFTVYGYVDGELYMNGAKVTKEGSGWTVSPVYYWPVGEPMNFYSYAPSKVAEMGTLLAADGSFSFDTYSCDGKTDFLYALNKDVTGVASKDSKAPQVKVNFRHALSRVMVQFKKKNSTGNYRFYVRNVTLKNIHTKGNFIYPDETTSGTPSKSSTGKWSEQSETGDMVLNTASASPAKGGIVAANSSGNMFVIPQNITEFDAEAGSGVYLEVECSFRNVETDHLIWPDATIADQTDDNYAKVRIPVRTSRTPEWEGGYFYLYTVGLDVPETGSNKIVFDVTVDDYQQVNDNGTGN